jgi:hypothetical protein
MQIRVTNSPFKISPKLIAVLQQQLSTYDKQIECGVCITFKDPEYSADTGGFHPVEIGLDPTGKLLYITDFAYVGSQPFVELAKEIDFDFQHGDFEHFGRVFPLHDGADLYALWEDNFLAYHAMNVYRVTVSDY